MSNTTDKALYLLNECKSELENIEKKIKHKLNKIDAKVIEKKDIKDLEVILFYIKDIKKRF